MPLPTLPLDADQPAGPSRRQVVLGAAAAAAAALLPATSHAQSAWPSKPVRVIVPFPPGGLTDAYARSYCEFMSRKFGQPFNIENKTGAGGTLGAGELAKSPPDGHTLLISRVWPSGGDLASSPAPSVPPAPVLFSMLKGWPNLRLMNSQ